MLNKTSQTGYLLLHSPHSLTAERQQTQMCMLTTNYVRAHALQGASVIKINSIITDILYRATYISQIFHRTEQVKVKPQEVASAEI